MIDGTVITSAVCRKLHSAFPDISIYREHICEDFDEPSFFVWSSAVRPSNQLWPRMFQRHEIEVRYFPVRGDLAMYEHLNSVGMSLLEILSSIDVEIDETTLPVFLSSSNYVIINDNTLNFSAEYQIECLINNGETAELMGKIDEINTHLK